MAWTWHTGTLVGVEYMSEMNKKFWVKTPENLPFKAGQFITMDLPISDKRLKICMSYSIANIPNEDNLLEFSIARLPGGAGTKYLFEDINPLFVSRYPQNQNKDFIKWMNSIPNSYLHFGDFDIAGIGIYLNEYKKHLSGKSIFFIPENIKSALRKNGNRERFDNQKINFRIDSIQESKVLDLIELIKKEKKGLDQEYYIETDSQR